MNWIEGSILLFGGLIAAMGLGLPVAFAFLVLNVVGAIIFLGGEAGLVQLVRNAVQSITSFSLTPIPFFVLMGEVLFHSGVALKAIDAFALIIRRVPGRLSVIAIVAGTVFSAISGSTIATTALLGSLMLPTMLERGYDKRLAMGPIMGIGGVDMLIPPSALAVLLGSLAGISISGLLIGGIVPGLILSVLFIGYIILRAYLNPALAPEEKLEDGPGGVHRWKPFLLHVLPLVLITLPFFMPLVQKLDVEPVWFGVLFLICMQLGLLTPPFGLLLFTMKGVAPPSITMNDVFRAAMPYVWFGLLVLLLVFMAPP